MQGETAYTRTRLLSEPCGHPGLQPSPKHLPRGGDGFLRLLQPHRRASRDRLSRRPAVHVSDVPVLVHFDDGQDSRREYVLALCELRRGLEHEAPSSLECRAAAMAVTNAELARALQELIEALDRRVPRVDRAGEASIARDSSALRERATSRLAEITGQ